MLAALCASAMFAGAEAADLMPVRIGVTHDARSGPLFVAEANGYFDKHGLKAELDFFDDDAAIADAVASGRIEIGVSDLTAPFFAAAVQNHFKLIAAESSDQTGFPITALLVGKAAYDAGFRTGADLAHKRVGMSGEGSGQRYALAEIEARYKLAPGDVDLVWLPTPDRELAELSSGGIDVAILPYPVAQQFQAAGRDSFIIRLSDFAQRQQSALFASTRTIAADRPLIEKFVRAYQRGATDYSQAFLERDDGGDILPGPRHDEYLALIARQAGTVPDHLQPSLPYCDRLARLDAADIGDQLKFWQGAGKVAKEATAADLLDLSFVAESAKQN
ncbi:MAG TPA: ABC transporter substrate-binding protein [Aliidongia sp.]|nr:ABC transporter substrate-binding protein [Aliidongia sp.]